MIEAGMNPLLLGFINGYATWPGSVEVSDRLCTEDHTATVPRRHAVTATLVVAAK